MIHHNTKYLVPRPQCSGHWSRGGGWGNTRSDSFDGFFCMEKWKVRIIFYAMNWWIWIPTGFQPWSTMGSCWSRPLRPISLIVLPFAMVRQAHVQSDIYIHTYTSLNTSSDSRFMKWHLCCHLQLQRSLKIFMSRYLSFRPWLSRLYHPAVQRVSPSYQVSCLLWVRGNRECVKTWHDRRHRPPTGSLVVLFSGSELWCSWEKSLLAWVCIWDSVSQCFTAYSILHYSSKLFLNMSLVLLMKGCRLPHSRTVYFCFPKSCFRPWARLIVDSTGFESRLTRRLSPAVFLACWKWNALKFCYFSISGIFCSRISFKNIMQNEPTNGPNGPEFQTSLQGQPPAPAPGYQIAYGCEVVAPFDSSCKQLDMASCFPRDPCLRLWMDHFIMHLKRWLCSITARDLLHFSNQFQTF